MAGTLFVVATPIGNLEDLTFRALRTLRDVDCIAAEDTRRTSKLLAHYEIRKPLVSLHEHNEFREAPRLVDRIAAGENIALVSDAGTPSISDPGARLVRAARDRGLKVIPVPGPSAVAAALSVSGFQGDQFVFLGFPPSSGSDRKRWMDTLLKERRTVVFFESPHRITRTLEEAATTLVNRQIIVLREISKIHEEFVEWHKLEPREINETGEFTVLVGPVGDHVETPDNLGVIAEALFGQLTDGVAFSDNEAIELTAKILHVDFSVIKKVIKKSKILAKQQNRPAP